MNPMHREALDRARQKAAEAAQHRQDPKDWARRVVAACERGDAVPRLQAREAHLALGLPVPRWAR
jgi:hypothetical protein